MNIKLYLCSADDFFVFLCCKKIGFFIRQLDSFLTDYNLKMIMKKIFYLPRFTMITLALTLTAGVIVVSGMGCASKPGCGSKHQHKVRAKKVRRMAPSMGG